MQSKVKQTNKQTETGRNKETHAPGTMCRPCPWHSFLAQTRTAFRLHTRCVVCTDSRPRPTSTRWHKRCTRCPQTRLHSGTFREGTACTVGRGWLWATPRCARLPSTATQRNRSCQCTQTRSDRTGPLCPSRRRRGRRRPHRTGHTLDRSTWCDHSPS
jgi:hypothetical protein